MKWFQSFRFPERISGFSGVCGSHLGNLCNGVRKNHVQSAATVSHHAPSAIVKRVCRCLFSATVQSALFQMLLLGFSPWEKSAFSLGQRQRPAENGPNSFWCSSSLVLSKSLLDIWKLWISPQTFPIKKLLTYIVRLDRVSCAS